MNCRAHKFPHGGFPSAILDKLTSGGRKCDLARLVKWTEPGRSQTAKPDYTLTIENRRAVGSRRLTV